MLILYRKKIYKNWILGLLVYRNNTWYIGERTWENNKKNISCIPADIYNLRMQKHKCRNGLSYPTWEIVGVSERINIEIHIGNIPKKDSRGCLLIGNSYNLKGVLNSKDAHDEFIKKTKSLKDKRIKIINIIPVEQNKNYIKIKFKEIKFMILVSWKENEKVEDLFIIYKIINLLIHFLKMR